MIRAEILLQGGHTITVDTPHRDVSTAIGKLKSDLTGGWMNVADRYLVHPGSVAAVHFYDTESIAIDGQPHAITSENVSLSR